MFKPIKNPSNLRGLTMLEKLKTTRILILATAILLPAAAVTILFNGSSASSNPLPTTARQVQQVQEAQTENAYRGRVRIFLHGDEIYPDTLRLQPGRILLSAENETQSDISLIIERVIPGQGREVVANVRTVRQAKRNEQELLLGVGEYTYYEESQPEIKGTLIVEPQQ
jgi:hypothetical protein